jgi:choline monooxygenase
MSIADIVDAYNPKLRLSQAYTPPSAWYTDQRFHGLEKDTVFTSSWLIAARLDQLQIVGDYIASEIAEQPIVVVNSETGIQAYYNVCRHHAAQVVESGQGCAKVMTCPYHGWSYRLDGSLIAAPLFDGVDNFVTQEQGLKKIRSEIWENWVFICLDDNAPSLETFLGDLYHQMTPLNLKGMSFYKRVEYELDCNWKVYTDNYLDGGYHVPFLHKGLTSALDNRYYQIEVNSKYCLQSCPTKSAENDFSQVRKGLARYYWQYPNLMINLYEGIMGITIVESLAVDKCRVIFEYYFDNSHPLITDEFKAHSVAAADKIQDEDVAICYSVQRGLASKGYETGRLSVKKEAGEHLFHQLLYQDYKRLI